MSPPFRAKSDTLLRMKDEYLPPISKDDVEALTKGLPTKSRSGDVTVGHRLTKREREIFERAKISGFLTLPYSPIRDNVINIYCKWCDAVGIVPDIRSRNPIHSRLCR
jgi:hypothetical protein